MVRASLVIACVLVLLNSRPSYSAVYLDFTSPTPGTIADAGGLGTGFTHRLPGTGSAIPANDPNLDISSSPGHLLIEAALSNIGAAGNLPGAEALGVFVLGVGSQDFVVTVQALNVDLPGVVGARGHFSIFVGTSTTNLIRAGLHDNNSFVITSNNGGGDVTEFGDPSYHFAYDSGDDMEISLRRTGGLWSLSWNNLSNPSAAIPSGSSPQFAFPFIDAQSDLYFGIVAADPTPSPSYFVGTLDSFSVQVGAVPEPASVTIWLVTSIIAAGGLGRQRLRRKCA